MMLLTAQAICPATVWMLPVWITFWHILIDKLIVVVVWKGDSMPKRRFAELAPPFSPILHFL